MRLAQCNRCQWPLPDGQPNCPRCGDQPQKEPASGAGADSWLPVARVLNLAEIGYFADLLEAETISTQIEQRNEFNAIDGVWRTTYVLRVPQEMASRAAVLLRDELENSAGEFEWQPQPAAAVDGRTFSGWTPVLLVLVAGSLAYCAGRVGMDPPRKPAPVRESLWQAIAEDQRPLVTGEHRRLRFDEGTGHIILEDDPDGDGRPRVRRFAEGMLVD